MFNRVTQICHCLQLYFLFIVLTDQNHQALVHARFSDEHLDRIIRAVNDTTSSQASNDQSKYKLSVHLTKDIRNNMIKSAFLIAGGILVLFLVSGLVSITVYYVRKKYIQSIDI